jgi:CRP-like cAMP-binding protein
MPHSKNYILSKLNTVDLEGLKSNIRVVDMPHGKVLAESRGRVEQVYFPHEGIISCVVELQDGAAIETGMIGKDGAFGAAQALDEKVSLHKSVIQVPGRASVVDSRHLKAAATSSPALLSLLMKYEQFTLGQVQQTAACNAVHTVEQRMCKWLVRMHNLTGDELPLTQEFLAQMMGVRRTSVTGVASKLQDEGMISYSRGKVRILDLDLIQRRACECANTVRELYATEFGLKGETSLRNPETLGRS